MDKGFRVRKPRRLFEGVLRLQELQTLAEALVDRADRAKEREFSPYHLIDDLAQKDSLFAELVTAIYLDRRLDTLSAGDEMEMWDNAEVGF